VTEAEWLAATDPWTMLKLVEGKASLRKLRLVAVACCLQAWRFLSERPGRIAVGVAERFADGAAGEDELQKAQTDAQIVKDETNPIRRHEFLRMAWDDPRALQAEATHYFASACASVAYPADIAFAVAAEAWSNVSLGLAMTSKNKAAHATEDSVLAGLARDVLR